MKTPKSEGRVLIIAASDSGGGAGVQADVKAVTALGGYAATAITALTVQNTRGVQAIESISAATVTRQAEAVLEDIGADCLKTGMLANEANVLAVAALARRYPSLPLVIDPVMVATSGDVLLERSALTALMTQLLPHATLLTPNLPEAELLTHMLINSKEGMVKAGQMLIQTLGCQNVLVKGGHLKGGEVMTDILVTASGKVVPFTSPRLKVKDGRELHGTGCTLASAIACKLAQGAPLSTAITEARQYLAGAISHAQGFGTGAMPLHHGWR